MTTVDSADQIGKRSCRVVVHRARNLKPRGKDTKSSPFVTISLGKEKFATSVVEKSQNPEWNEDCELTVRPRDSKLELTVLHQDFFLERFLGKVDIPLMEVEAAPKRSIRGWYKLTGKPNRNKKEDKNRGELEITAQMKGDENKTILPSSISVKSFSKLDVHPLRKSTSTPFIASLDQTSTNPFADDEEHSTSNGHHVQRASSPQDVPQHDRTGDSEPPKSPVSRLSATSPQKESSPTFQRQGMGRKIVRTSIRKDKESLHGSTPNLVDISSNDLDTPFKRQITSYSSQTSVGSTFSSASGRFRKKSHTISSQEKPKDLDVAMKKVEQSAMRRVEQSGDASPLPILRTLSEECLSKSAESLDLEDKEERQPAKRTFYKPTSKSARRSARANSQYYERDVPSPTPTPPASLPSSPTHTFDDPPSFPTTATAGEDSTDIGVITAPISEFADHPYQSYSKEELIKKIIDLENDVKDKDRQLSLQERYIDELLLKVIMVAPGLLDQGFQPKPSIKARSPVQRYQAKKQEVII